MSEFTPALCLGAIVLAFLVLMLLACRWAEGKGNREIEAWEDSWRALAAWQRGEPDPSDPQYSGCWRSGGGERFVSDLERYHREHPKPKTIKRRSTTGGWK